MKRKLMSVVMALVMVMTLLSGCGSKEESNSTFFKEVQKLSTIESGTSTMEGADSGAVFIRRRKG